MFQLKKEIYMVVYQEVRRRRGTARESSSGSAHPDVLASDLWQLYCRRGNGTFSFKSESLNSRCNGFAYFEKLFNT